MKIIIAGSRNIDKYLAFYKFIQFIEDTEAFFEKETEEIICEFVTGDCPTGPDQVPYLLTNIEAYVREFTITAFPADWNKHGKAAGPIRNKEMAEYADGLLLIWNGKSRGSANMKKEMEKLNKPVYEIII